MTSLEVTITAGPKEGQRLLVNQSPASFGRDAANPLVIDLPTVSRVHGEFRYEDDRWQLFNLSANGTSLDRKKLTKKPRPVHDGDTVSIGNQVVMRVALRSGRGDAVAATDDQAVQDEPARKARINPRAALWISIIGFWVLVFTLAFVFLGLDEPTKDNRPTIKMLSETDIAEEVRLPREKREESARNAANWFSRAEGYYQTINANDANIYKAYDAYRTALSYTSGNSFNDPASNWAGINQAELAQAQLRFFELEERLITDVTEQYKDAYGKLKSQRYDAARDAFKVIMDYYQDPRSDIHRNAQRLRDSARRNAQGR